MQALHRLVELGPAQVVQRHQPVEPLLERVARVLDERDLAVLLVEPAGALADLVLLRLLAQVEVAAHVGVQAGVAELVDDGLDGGGAAHQLVAQQRREAGVAGQAGQHDDVDVAAAAGRPGGRPAGRRPRRRAGQQHAAVVAGIGVEALQHGEPERARADAAAEHRREADDRGAVAHDHDVQLAVVAARRRSAATTCWPRARRGRRWGRGRRADGRPTRPAASASPASSSTTSSVQVGHGPSCGRRRAMLGAHRVGRRRRCAGVPGVSRTRGRCRPR